MLLGSGSIRKEELGPVVTLQDLLEIFPYDDSIHLIQVTGKQLKQMMLYMLRDEAFDGGHTEFYQLSCGIYLEYSYKDKKLIKFSLDNQDIDDKTIYKIGLQKYHYLNFEECFNIKLKDIEKNSSIKVIATSCRDILEEYFTEHQRLNVDKLNRLIIKK